MAFGKIVQGHKSFVQNFNILAICLGLTHWGAGAEEKAATLKALGGPSKEARRGVLSCGLPWFAHGTTGVLELRGQVKSVTCRASNSMG